MLLGCKDREKAHKNLLFFAKDGRKDGLGIINKGIFRTIEKKMYLCGFKTIP